MDLQKNLDRLENLLFNICGCSKEEARIVAQEFLNELDCPADVKREIKKIRNIEYENRLNHLYKSGKP